MLVRPFPAFGGALLALALAHAPLLAQSASPTTPGGKILTLADYDRWSRISATGLSPDGAWMSYAYTPNEGDGRLHLRRLDRDTLLTVANGTAPQFSPDSRWVAYAVGPAGGGGRGGRGGGATPPATPAGRAGAGAAPGRRIELRDLRTMELVTIPGATSVSFTEDARFALIRLPKAVATATHDGADLLVRELATGVTRNLGNVGLYALNKGDTHLAYTVDAANKLGNGVYLTALATGETRTLDSWAADYAQLTWSTDGRRIAVLRGEKAPTLLQRENTLLLWTDATSSTTPIAVATDQAPRGMIISEFASLRWSDDGQRVLLGVKEQSDAPPAGRDSTQQANVDVWHWLDPEPQSVQVVRLAQERRATYPAVYHVSSRALRTLGDSAMRTVTTGRALDLGVGRLDAPYRGEVAWGGSRADYYRVNTVTGERTLIERALSRTMGLSPSGEWFLYLKEGKVYAFNMKTAAKVQVDAAAKRSFVDVTDDHPYELPVYGVAGWSKDGASVLLYDQYDLWQLSLSGAPAVNLTRGEGAKQSIRFRIVQLDRSDEDDGLDLTKPLLLSAYGEWTKKSGYWELAPGGTPTPRIWLDKSVGGIAKATKSDRIMMTQSTFREYPDVWVSNTQFASPRKITDANPFLSEYAWGSKVLVDYKNAKGKRMQGTLTLPANYEPGKKYPMIVYFYETMSQTHHNFSMPVYDDRPHISTYASNGYLVLQPDVTYEIGRPGTSAVDHVTAAVKEVIKLGYADPKRIGLQGHSWGGYQSSFIVTQTDLFAAVVTGAPPTNLVSFVGTLYRSSGTIQQGITENGQVRIGVGRTPWNSKALYESQSPIHHVEKITTPFMILHGTADGSVDWSQGLEFYAAARRLGKNVIFLSYPDEGHHLGRRPNQKDFQVRMKQYFDHYLKGEPAPQWMTNGVPAVQKGGPIR